MATSLPTDEQIDAYLLDQLDEQAEAALEARMAAEPAVKEAVLLRKMERAAVEQLIAKDLRAKMEGWQAERDATTPSATRLRPLWIGGLLAAAAAVALLIWVMLPKTPARSSYEEELLALGDDRWLQESRGGAGQDPASPKTQWNQAIEQEDWSQAIEVLTAIPASDSVHYPWAQNILGYNLLQAGEYEAAAKQFQTLLDPEPTQSRLLHSYQWHLLLSWRLAGPIFQVQADSLAVVVQTEGHTYRDKAEALSRITP